MIIIFLKNEKKPFDIQCSCLVHTEKSKRQKQLVASLLKHEKCSATAAHISE